MNLAIRTHKLRTDIHIIVLMLFLFILVTRIPGLTLMPEALYNVDERETVLSSLDRFLGLPTTALVWPAATQRLIGTPLVAIAYLLENFGNYSQTSIVHYFSHTYRDPNNLIQLMRWFVTLFSSISFALLYLPIYKSVQSRLAAILGVLIVALNPFVWQFSHMAVAPALALSFGCLAFLFLQSSRFQLLGFFFTAAMVASRTDFAFLCPFIVFSGLPQKNLTTPTWLWLIKASLTLCISYALLNPYIWIDPVRFLKGVLGNVAIVSTSNGLIGFLSRLVEFVNLPVFILGSVGLLIMFLRHKVVSFGLIITLILYVYIFSTADDVLTRYFVPLTLPLAYLGSLSAGYVLTYAERYKVNLLVLISLLLSVVIGILPYYQTLQSHWHLDHNRQEAKKQIETMAGSNDNITVFVAYDQFIGFYSDIASQESIMNIRDKIPFNIEDIQQFVKLDKDFTELIHQSLNEFEQALYGRTNAMALTSVEGPQIDLRLYHNNELVAARYGIYSLDSTIDAFASCIAEILLIDAEVLGEEIAQDLIVEFQDYEIFDYGSYHLIQNEC